MENVRFVRKGYYLVEMWLSCFEGMKVRWKDEFFFDMIIGFWVKNCYNFLVLGFIYFDNVCYYV